MKSVYNLLNAGIANARRSLDHYHMVNESGMDQYGRKVAVMDPDEYNQRINALNSEINAMKRASRIIKTHEIRKKYATKHRMVLFILFGVVPILITATFITQIKELGVIAGFAVAWMIALSMIQQDLL